MDDALGVGQGLVTLLPHSDYVLAAVRTVETGEIVNSIRVRQLSWADEVYEAVEDRCGLEAGSRYNLDLRLVRTMPAARDAQAEAQVFNSGTFAIPRGPGQTVLIPQGTMIFGRINRPAGIGNRAVFAVGCLQHSPLIPISSTFRPCLVRPRKTKLRAQNSPPNPRWPLRRPRPRHPTPSPA